jgi:DNA-binding NarL/FixJ family response regulator
LTLCAGAENIAIEGHASPVESKRLRVLHVDDNREARELLSLILSYERDLEDVGSHHEAAGLVKLVRERSPDVLLIDLTMSGRDPIDAIRELRAEFPRLRIVVLSGSSDPKVLDRARAAGASEIARKGIDVSDTLKAIRGSPR